jgi:hypothetical protein
MSSSLPQGNFIFKMFYGRLGCCFFCEYYRDIRKTYTCYQCLPCYGLLCVAMACYVLLWRTRLRGGCTIAGITRCFFLMEPRFEHLQTFVKPYLNVRKPSQTFMNLHEATFERSQMFLNLCEPM